jgi:hypothetical protein
MYLLWKQCELDTLSASYDKNNNKNNNNNGLEESE